MKFKNGFLRYIFIFALIILIFDKKTSKTGDAKSDVLEVINAERNNQKEKNTDQYVLAAFNSATTIVSDFNKAIITISSAFIGGTLLSIDKIQSLKNLNDKLSICLWLGCILLIGSILFSMISQLISSSALYDIVDGPAVDENGLQSDIVRFKEEKRAKVKDNWIKYTTRSSFGFLIVAMLLITVFFIKSALISQGELSMSNSPHNPNPSSSELKIDDGVRTTGLGRRANPSPPPPKPPAPPKTQK